ncbi:ATP-dependent helicase, partial [Streptomyces sp. ISL-1]|nr:ATP-dependent helicase [Streptomyces sp. ISL-1]
TVEAEPVAEVATKPRRRTRAAKPVVEVAVETVVETTEPETKPRRRTRAAKPVVEVAVDTPEPETKPRRRTRTVKATQPES